MRSISPRESLNGSQMTPPLPPPNGTLTTAHFQVIQAARARTSSRVALGAGSVGFTVRCTPQRRTVLVGEGEGAWFAKLRSGGPHAARAEWHWLHRLRELGFRVPDALVLRCGRRESLVGTARARGRPL